MFFPRLEPVHILYLPVYDFTIYNSKIVQLTIEPFEKFSYYCTQVDNRYRDDFAQLLRVLNW